eukprot:TRINITY_DN7949_c0_g1_i1.p1 TRINITY_DN7949_c0_g1~~TRINITY_DN7949_c0_g1_i1.p1  ORF type:complete len:380 (-),score=95.12 TRINITY_DN7949_c0_g1_i1:11-1093(-)
MCRLAIYLGPPIVMSHFVTEPKHSIIKQSVEAYEAVVQLNGDGFGVAWYSPHISSSPALFREVSPAWNNENLRELARVTMSNCVLAHVRKASPASPVVLTNCHPYTHHDFGFMHNGYIENFQKVKKRIVNMLSDEAYALIKGSTDSEHAFALFIEYFPNALNEHKGDKLEAMATAISRVITTIEEIVREVAADKEEETCQLNFVVTDGNNVIATRYTTGELQQAHTLFYCTGSKYHLKSEGTPAVEGTPVECDHETEEEEKHQQMVIIASEPLTDDGEFAFKEVKPNYMVLADRENISMRSIEKLIEITSQPPPSPLVFLFLSRSLSHSQPHTLPPQHTPPPHTPPHPTRARKSTSRWTE